MADDDHRDRPQEISVLEARQGQPRGFVRYVMYTSLVLAIIGMLIAYLVIAP